MQRESARFAFQAVKEKDRQQSGDPEKYSAYKSSIDTKQETQTLSVPGKGRGPKTATKKLKKSKCTNFIQNREKSFLSAPPPLALSTWGKHSPWFRAARARCSRAGSCLGPFLPLCSPQELQGLWVPQPKSQGLLNTDGKTKQNPIPSHVHLLQQNSSETNLHGQFLLQNFKSSNMRSPEKALLPTALQRLLTPRPINALTFIRTLSSPREDETLKGRKGK